MEAVRAALGHGGDLQTARAPIFGLVALGENLHLADGLDVHGEHLPVAARVHRRDAVHHDVVLTRAAEPGSACRRASRHHPGRKHGEVREIAAADGKIFDLLCRDGERSLGARRLQQGRLGNHGDGFLCAARFERQDRNRDPLAGADGHTRPRQRSEPGHRHFNRVGIRRGVRKDVVPGCIRDRGERPRASRFADEDNSRPGNDAALAVLDRTRYRPGSDLRGSRHVDDPQRNESNREQGHKPNVHVSSFGRTPDLSPIRRAAPSPRVHSLTTGNCRSGKPAVDFRDTANRGGA